MISRILSFLLMLVLLATLPIGAAGSKVEFKESQYRIDVLIDGRLFTSYLHTPDPSRTMVVPGIIQAKPVLYPVHSPSGVTLTRDFPFASTPGEDRDHPHHIGISFTVDNVGPDNDGFWGNSRNPLPVIRHVKVLEMKGGSGVGRLATVSHWIGKSGKPLLEEQREMIFRAATPDRSEIDFTIYLKALDQEIGFGDTKEGMFAFRVAQWLTEKATGRYLNSNGEEMEKGVWGKRADWVRLQGEKEGKKIGIAILNHPSSTNSPTWWHARGYGCFSVNPLGQLDFEKAHKAESPQPFNLKIKPGEKALFKYRVVLYEGDMDKAQADSLYRAYAGTKP